MAFSGLIGSVSVTSSVLLILIGGIPILSKTRFNQGIMDHLKAMQLKNISSVGYEMEEFFEDANIILKIIRRKALIALIISLGIIIPGSLATGIDFEGITLPSINGAIEPFDFLIWLFNFVVFLMFKTNFILDETEKRFLKNYRWMLLSYYKKYLTPRIIDFNNRFEHLFKRNDNQEMEIKILKEKIRNIEKELKDVQSLKEIRGFPVN